MKKWIARAGRVLLSVLFILGLEALPLLNQTVFAATTLTINGAQQYQTMDGFGTSINSASWKNGELKPALDKLADGGTKLWRVIIDNTDWEATNDDSDPNNFNWTYYNTVYTSAKFQDLWNTIAYLNQKGFTNNVIIDFMGPGPSWMGGDTLTTTDSNKNEWVEMISSLVYYARNTAHLQFGMLAPANEPDWQCTAYHEGMCISASVYADILNRLAVKLDAIGVSDLRLVGPDTAMIANGVGSYMPAMMAQSSLMAKVDHFAFHDYNGATGGADAAIKASSYPTKDFWMSEVSQFNDAFPMIGQNTAGILTWDGFDSVYNHAILHGGGSVAPNDAGDAPALLAYNSSTGVYTARKEYYQFEQLFKYVSAGAVRVAATQNASGVTTYAFTDAASGRVTIIGNNTSSSSVTFNGTLANIATAVPAFEYYTTDSGNTNFQRGTDVAVSAGTFTVVAPANGIFTLTYAGTPDTTAPTAPVLSAANPNQASLTWSGATDNIGISSYDVYRGATAGFSPATAGTKVAAATSATSFIDTGLSAGTYYYQVQARDAAGNVSPSSNEVAITIVPDTTPPSTPANVRLVNTSASSHTDLAWDASTDVSGIKSYTIKRSIGTIVNNPTVLSSSVTGTTFNDTTVAANGVYTYTVSATDNTNNVSQDSTPLTVIVPSAPALALKSTVVTHQTSAASSITSSSFSASSGDLIVAFLGSDGPSGSAQTFTTPTTSGLSWTLRKRANTSGSGTAEIWTAVAPSSFSSGTLSATRGSGSYQGSVTIAVFSGADTSATPATASASGTNSAPSVSLTTTRAGSWVWGTGDDWTSVASRTAGTSQTIVDQYLPAGIGAYWVQRQNDPTANIGSVTINDTTPSTSDKWNLAAIEIVPAPVATPDTTAPVFPAGSSATAQALSTTQVQLGWPTGATDNVAVTGYQITRVQSGDTNVVTLPAANASTFSLTDSGLTPGATYAYSVRATDAAGNLSPALQATVTLPVPDTQAPDAPGNLQLTNSATTGLTFSWSKPADNVGVTSYQVWRSDNTASPLATISGGDTLSFADTGLTPATTYSYTVKAVDAAGNVSVASAVLDATTLADLQAPTTPANLTASNVNLNSLTLSWSTSTDDTAMAGYQVWRSDSSGGTYTLVSNTASGTSFSDSGLQSGTTYYYFVRALDVYGNSADSLVLQITTATPDATPPTVPTLSVSATSFARAHLSWTASMDTGGLQPYTVQRNGQTIGTTTGTSFDDNGLTPGQTYAYTVIASDVSNNTASSSASVTLPVMSMTAPSGGVTVSGSVAVTANTVTGVAGVQFLLDGTALSSEDTTAPYSITWDSTTVANGTHSLSAQVRDSFGNTTTASAVGVTVSNIAAAIATDVNVSTDSATTSSATLVSPTFSTASANELLVAFVQTSGPGTSGGQTVKSMTGGGLTWTMRQRANTRYGTAEIWTAPAAAKLTNVAVTATRNVSGFTGSITVMSFTGASLTIVGAVAKASATTGLPSVSLTTTKIGSLIFGTGNDWDGANARTAGSNQSIVHQYIQTTTGDTYWVQKVSTASTAVGQTVTVNDVSPTPSTHQWNLAAIEIIPQ